MNIYSFYLFSVCPGFKTSSNWRQDQKQVFRKSADCGKGGKSEGAGWYDTVLQPAARGGGAKAVNQRHQREAQRDLQDLCTAVWWYCHAQASQGPTAVLVADWGSWIKDVLCFQSVSAFLCYSCYANCLFINKNLNIVDTFKCVESDSLLKKKLKWQKCDFEQFVLYFVFVRYLTLPCRKVSANFRRRYRCVKISQHCESYHVSTTCYLPTYLLRITGSTKFPSEKGALNGSGNEYCGIS